MSDPFLAVLLSAGLSGPAPPPRMPPCSIVAGPKLAETSILGGKVHVSLPPPVRALPPRSPLIVTAPRESTGQPIVWQCADRSGQLFKHREKAYLEAWVAQRNAQLRSGEAAQQAQTVLRQAAPFMSPAPGYGYSAGMSPPGRT